jgi:hypothetical protein
MLDLIVQYIRVIDVFLVAPSPTRAIVFALLFSWGLTHGVRFYTVRKLNDDVAKNLEEVVSFLSCFIPCLLLWPEYKWNLSAFFASAILAIWSPFAYRRIGPLITHFIPWLDPTPSASPKLDISVPAPLDPDQQQKN